MMATGVAVPLEDRLPEAADILDIDAPDIPND